MIDLAPKIEHTLLAPAATPLEIGLLCDEAKRLGLFGVCVQSGYVTLAERLLHGTAQRVVAVVGFPLGGLLTEAKAFEAREASRRGARELDMVLNLGALFAREHDRVEADIRAVVEAVHGVPVKVIVESHLLDEERLVIACELAKRAGAAFVKSCTGFTGGGATEEAIALMRRSVGPSMGVKASGGIRSREQAERMVAAGATRIGASASAAILASE